MAHLYLQKFTILISSGAICRRRCRSSKVFATIKIIKMIFWRSVNSDKMNKFHFLLQCEIVYDRNSELFYCHFCYTSTNSWMNFMFGTHANPRKKRNNIHQTLHSAALISASSKFTQKKKRYPKAVETRFRFFSVHSMEAEWASKNSKSWVENGVCVKSWARKRANRSIIHIFFLSLLAHSPCFRFRFYRNNLAMLSKADINSNCRPMHILFLA